MAAFLPHPVLIFNSGKTVRQSRWWLFFFVAAADHQQRQTVRQSQQRLSSASLGALRPSSAGFMSVQTSSALATHTRTFCLQRQAWGLQRVRSKWAAFLRRFEISVWLSPSDSEWHQVPSLQLWRNEGLRERVTMAVREQNQKVTQQGCIWDWPTPKGQASVCVKIESASVDCSHDQDKKGNKIPVVSVCDRGKQMGNYSTSSHIYTVDYEIKGDRHKMLRKTITVGNVP